MRQVLFVCGGNTCRSPMAGALAEHVVPGLRAGTAGVAPGDRLAGHAATVIAERTGAPAKMQDPVGLNEIDPGLYDSVVAMDLYVADEVIPWMPPALPLFIWKVQDPYGGTLDDYRKAADAIEDLLRATFLADPRFSLPSLDNVAPDPLSDLDAYLADARDRIGSVAPSHCNGIAAQAARSLERLLKALLADRLARNRMTVTSVLDVLHRKGPADAQKLALGTVVDALGWLAKKDDDLRLAWSAGAGEAAREFVTIRNTEIHDADLATIVDGTVRLLDLVDAVVANDSFRPLLATAVSTDL